jgi:hypothetical protein
MVHHRAAYLALLLGLLAAPVLAQSRPTPIPADARLGLIRHVEAMAVTVDGKAMQLAAGAQVRDQQNLIIVPVSIPRNGAWAGYTLNAQGQVFRVWLLTPAELARRKSKGGS